VIEKLNLTILDIERSFGSDGIGKAKGLLVSMDGSEISFSAGAWRLGQSAYDFCKEYFADEFEAPPFTHNQQAHHVNIAICNSIVEVMLDFIQDKALNERIKDINHEAYSEGEILEWRSASVIDQALLIDGFISTCNRSFDIEANLGRNIYFYCVMHLLDKYIFVGKPWSDEANGLLDKAAIFQALLDKSAEAIRRTKNFAKKAATARHEENYRIKESLKEWHKNNRHRFINQKGRLNQTKAAAEAKKIEPISAKKAAEYMGEFERALIDPK
jgi:hypothetical protein